MHLTFLPNAHAISLRYPTENCTSASHCYQSYLRYRCCISNISLIFIFLIHAAYCSRLFNKLIWNYHPKLSHFPEPPWQSLREAKTEKLTTRRKLKLSHCLIGYLPILYVFTLVTFVTLTQPWIERFTHLDLDSTLSSLGAWRTRLGTSSIRQITCSTTIGLLSR